MRTAVPIASPALSLLLLLLLALALLPAAQAQQQVPFQNGVPVAPTGLADQPLGEGPWTFPTAEGHDIRVVVQARMRYPTAVTFLPEGGFLVTSRTGDLYQVAASGGEVRPVAGGPETVFRGQSGSLGAVHGYIDIALHPDFSSNNYVYLSYTKPLDDSTALAIGRGVWNGVALEDFSDIWVADPGVAGVSRIAFDGEGKLYATVSGADPQDLATVGGKVIRLNDDGSVPRDNPFVDTKGARPEIYTWGHRGALGLALHEASGQMWQNENGPNGGDEVNILKPGANYGWPVVSFGRTYQGPWQSDHPTHENYEFPVVYWMPAIAVSGMTFYTGDAFPRWRGDLFVGALRTGEIPGTGHLERILFNENLEELRRESLLAELRQRIRDVRQGPDGLLYVVTDEPEGALLRIEPAD